MRLQYPSIPSLLGHRCLQPLLPRASSHHLPYRPFFLHSPTPTRRTLTHTHILCRPYVLHIALLLHNFLMHVCVLRQFYTPSSHVGLDRRLCLQAMRPIQQPPSIPLPRHASKANKPSPACMRGSTKQKLQRRKHPLQPRRRRTRCKQRKNLMRSSTFIVGMYAAHDLVVFVHVSSQCGHCIATSPHHAHHSPPFGS